MNGFGGCWVGWFGCLEGWVVGEWVSIQVDVVDGLFWVSGFGGRSVVGWLAVGWLVG